MIAMVEGAERQKTPNEIALNILLVGMTIIFLIVVGRRSSRSRSMPARTVSGRLPDRAARDADPDHDRRAFCRRSASPAWTGWCSANVIAKSGRAVEAAGNVDTLLIDKTGTITLRQPRWRTEFLPLPGVAEQRARRGGAQLRLAQRRDARGPLDRRAGEGRRYGMRGRMRPSVSDVRAVQRRDAHERRRRSTTASDPQGRRGRDPRPMPDLGRRPIRGLGGRSRARSRARAARRSVVADGPRLLGASISRTSSSPASRSASPGSGAMGIRTVMVTGDNPCTAAAIATEAGVDGFPAEATPEKKLARIRLEQNERSSGRDVRRRRQRRPGAGPG